MIDSAASKAASLPLASRLTAVSIPFDTRSMLSGTPITPVDATTTCEGRIPSRAARRIACVVESALAGACIRAARIANDRAHCIAVLGDVMPADQERRCFDLVRRDDFGANVRAPQVDQREIGFPFLDPGGDAGQTDPRDGAEPSSELDEPQFFRRRLRERQVPHPPPDRT